METKAKSERLKALKSQLAEADEHLDRWNRLASKFQKETDAHWRNVRDIRQQDVELLKRLIELTEAN